MKKKEVAIIEIGSSVIHLTVAAVDDKGGWQILEQANKPIPLGRDVFLNGRISRSAIRQTIQILSGYRELVKAYDVEELRAVGTSCLNESQNVDTFLDLIYQHTETVIRVLEESEELQYIFLAVLHGLKRFPPLPDQKPTLILEAGCGKTYLLVMENCTVTAAKTLDLSTTRMIHELNNNVLRTLNLSAVKERIEKIVGSFGIEELPDGIEYLVGAGGELRLTAEHMGFVRENKITCLNDRELEGCIRELVRYIETNGTEVLDFEGQGVENLLFSLLIYSHFLHKTAANHFNIPWVSISDGILQDIAPQVDRSHQQMFQPHALASARELARKYKADLVHAEKVKQYALTLFDYLKEEFGLIDNQRFYLEIAALLHDVGKFIDYKKHNYHGQYLVKSETIFGLSDSERIVIGNLILEHCGEVSKKREIPSGLLLKEEQVGIAKIAAILRLAEVLDGSHKQKISDLTFEKSDVDLVIHAATAEDLSVERGGVLAQSQIFEDVFGLKPLLL